MSGNTLDLCLWGLVCTGATLPLGELVSGGVAARPPRQPKHCPSAKHTLRFGQTFCMMREKTEALLLFLLKHKIN